MWHPKPAFASRIVLTWRVSMPRGSGRWRAIAAENTVRRWLFVRPIRGC